MLATLDLVQKNIDRLSPWRDVINQFLSGAVDSLRLDDFIEDAIKDLTRDNVISKFYEAGEELMGLISAKAALEHAISICDGKWEWVLREDGNPASMAIHKVGRLTPTPSFAGRARLTVCLTQVCSAPHILVNQCHDGPLHVLAAIITNERYQKIDGILDLLLLSGMWVGQEVTMPLHVLSDATVHLGEVTSCSSRLVAIAQAITDHLSSARPSATRGRVA